jgi:hypothetical protein
MSFANWFQLLGIDSQSFTSVRQLIYAGSVKTIRFLRKYYVNKLPHLTWCTIVSRKIADWHLMMSRYYMSSFIDIWQLCVKISMLILGIYLGRWLGLILSPLSFSVNFVLRIFVLKIFLYVRLSHSLLRVYVYLYGLTSSAQLSLLILLCTIDSRCHTWHVCCQLQFLSLFSLSSFLVWPGILSSYSTCVSG